MFSSISFLTNDSMYSFTCALSVPYAVFFFMYSITSSSVRLFMRNDTLNVFSLLYFLLALFLASVAMLSSPLLQGHYTIQVLHEQYSVYFCYLMSCKTDICHLYNARMITPLPGYNTYRISLSLCRLINKKEFQYMIFIY